MVGCSKSSAPVATQPSSVSSLQPSAPAPAGGTGFLVGAGDIGYCGTGGAESTAKLLDRLPGTVFTAGDNAYMSGTLDEYNRCYDPSWGRHRGRTRPTPGNHEYESGAIGYFDYFGASAGPSGAGYYAFAIGGWRIIALNSELPSSQGSAQAEWLRRELLTQPSACTAVIWHRPLFSSGPNGDNSDMRDVWRTLYEFNVEIVINGHDHIYERFAPQDPDGRPDPIRGIREFVAGTGGAPLYQVQSVRANSEERATTWGVLSLTLTPGMYAWEFIPVEGGSYHDAGSGTCH
jgi:hypothetical protein